MKIAIGDLVLRNVRPSRLDRVAKAYEVDPVSGCWNWTKTKHKGYGVIRGRVEYGGQRNWLAHRLMWAAPRADTRKPVRAAPL